MVRRPGNRAVVTAMLLGTALLAGCNSPAELGAEADDYLARLSRVLRVGIPPSRDTPLVPFPRPRLLRYEVPPVGVDGISFLKLHGCDLGALMGFRAGPLGRVMPASERLGYEVSVLRQTAWCRRGSADPPQILAEIERTKRAQLPALFWNAVFAGSEIRRWFSLAGPRGMAYGAGTATHLQRLHRMSRDLGDLTFDADAFLATLSALAGGTSAGGRRQVWAQFRMLHTRATQMLKNADEVCPRGRATPRGKTAKNVLMRIYGQRIQPRLAAGHSADRRWVESLNALVDDQSVATDAFSTWFNSTYRVGADSEWEQLTAAIGEHTRSWQRLLDSCGLAPSAP